MSDTNDEKPTDLLSMLGYLRKQGLRSATFHVDGGIASVEFFDREPEPQPASGSSAAPSAPLDVEVGRPTLLGAFPSNDALWDTAKTK